MSLPFLKSRNIASVIMARAKPEGGIEPMNEEGECGPELMSAAEDLISAISSKDSAAVASALKAAFEICSAYPEEDEDME